jgi:FtsP/CotA-like multicopper oxidase with cupredoxin domain
MFYSFQLGRSPERPRVEAARRLPSARSEFNSRRSALLLVLVCLAQFAASGLRAEVVDYEFTIDELVTELGGVTAQSLAIDGQIPAPTLRARRGDTLRVTFHNALEVAASIHWHGLLLPGDQDGVPFLNTPPIEPQTSFTFEFPVIQSGTFWYHSHTDMQIQRGVYGSIVLGESASNPKVSHAGHQLALQSADSHAAHDASFMPDKSMQEAVVLFSDWTAEPATRVLENLKKDDDYYAFKKNTVQSWDRVLANGRAAVGARLGQGFTRMGPMDLADVGYDAFLANGVEVGAIAVESPGAKEIKLQLINGSTSSYFDVEYAGGPMRVVAADGLPVQPISVQRLRMATAETYDVIVPLTAGKAFELRASSFDGTGFSSTYVGAGERIPAPTIPRPNLIAQSVGHGMAGGMSHAESDSGHAHQDADHGQHSQASQHVQHSQPVQPAQHAQHAMHAQSAKPSHGSQSSQRAHGGTQEEIPFVPHLLSYESLIAADDTRLPEDRPVRVIPLELTGNMQRYVWGFNGKTQRQDPRLSVAAGDTVRLEMSNTTMMHHPIHLHGHYFRVLNGQGDRSPLKHTVDVPPMGKVVIEFSATENQDWLFHCHNQYHMKSGMNRVISYVESSLLDAQVERDILPYRRWYSRNALRLQDNVIGLDYALMDERHSVMFEGDHSLDRGRDNFELRASYSYQLSRFSAPFVSAERRVHADGAQETRLFAGLRTTLPFFIDSELGFDDGGKARLELGSGLQLTRRLALDWRWNTDEEYRLGLGLNLSNRTALVVGRDSDFGTGIGFSYLF